jgi:hypothetical protein
MKQLVRCTREYFLIVEGKAQERCIAYAKQTAIDNWSSGTCAFTAAPTCGKFELGQANNSEGDMVPAWGFDFNGMFIVNAKLEESGRFAVTPDHYGLTQEEADELERLNADRDVL